MLPRILGCFHTMSTSKFDQDTTFSLFGNSPETDSERQTVSAALCSGDECTWVCVNSRAHSDFTSCL